MKKLFAVRGATTSENTKDSIIKNTRDMCQEIFFQNNISACDIVSINFSVTRDINALNPCTALRTCDVGLDTSGVALFCTQEAEIIGMLPRVIRVMIYVYLNDDSKVKPVYINGAQVLRPDITQ